MNEVVFRLPDVGEGLAEAEVVEWLAGVGDAVRADQPVVTIETAKAQVELPSPVDGVMLSLGGGPGDVIPVGEPLFVVATDGGAAAGHIGTGASTDDGGDSSGGGRPPAPAPEPGPSHRVLAAPSTRRLAVELGVDLRGLAGTGPNGRVTVDDVRAAAAAASGPATPGSPRPLSSAASSPSRRSLGSAVAEGAPSALARPPSGADSEIRPLRGLRRQIARAMTAAWTVPHITEFREIDATALERAHRELRSAAGEADPRLTLLPLLVRAVVTALRQHPLLNATLDLDAEQVEVHHRRNIGIAAATGDGLIVPVVSDADRYSIAGLGREINRLGAAARERSLSVAETAGGTFTVSNFGSYGTWLGTPLISPPQVAIAGFGRVRDAVVPVDGVPAVRRVLPVAVSADHRLIDGDQLGAFVNTVERLVAAPLLLLGEVD
ncbi:dihydrolipoamide acetyltransferase family protein [Parafrankia sp. EUN1f]|uniref:dihydrolipoamide acetyltransferase family protein n=1 Tax=Parafrankia sp. EUN1f TaxID=102897 RepID=UPI0001C46361|nr:dihydrolipoamide acetyltransferase family protein [Parafrankia sp. EUN1f]EFC81433.1 catalytic domain of component of various dehydrogenase complexes [Parafrankia sp. EUN1f]